MQKVYGERRCPKFEVEKKCLLNVYPSTTWYRKELRDCQYKIVQKDDPLCDYTGCSQEVAQTIQHVLDDCPAFKTVREE